ncbi:para-nitrobenzyl esterase-like [Anticarsia gemmatalis]|uniref:para-nitrobenzyl esterase-like n=1 Tax=Anticarsia gemmatalis TaxID=129554 RepID=UPI003F757CF8
MCALIYVLLCITACGAVRGPLARPAAGPVRGLARDFTMFLGVPYGKIQEGDYFIDALPYPTFTEEFQATKEPVKCPQHNKRGFEGDIHCLNLNVYTPNNITPNSKLPVMVYIHGGGFSEGDGNLRSYSPKLLVKKNVIVVTINYRVGLHGFLCLPYLGVSNQGLKDQQLALKWIKNNIAAFGGDDDNITLFGHSAGSISIDIHLLYGQDDLFNKAILQSGNLVSPILHRDVEDDEFIRGVGWYGVLSEVFWTTDMSVKRTSTMVIQTKKRKFQPCIDGEFITEKPKNTNFRNKRIMIGNTNKEMYFFYKNTTDYTSKYEEFLNYSFTGIESTDVESFKTFYSTGNTKDDAVRFGTDIAFSYPLERSVRYYLDNRATVFRYLFSYDGERNYVKIRDNIIGEGATHGDELGYLFGLRLKLFKLPLDVQDHRMISFMTTAWTNFAKYGEPTPKGSSLPSWPKYEKNNKYLLNIGSEIQVLKDPFSNCIAFLDDFYNQHGANSTGTTGIDLKLNNADNFLRQFFVILLGSVFH